MDTRHTMILSCKSVCWKLDFQWLPLWPAVSRWVQSKNLWCVCINGPFVGATGSGLDFIGLLTVSAIDNTAGPVVGFHGSIVGLCDWQYSGPSCWINIYEFSGTELYSLQNSRVVCLTKSRQFHIYGCLWIDSGFSCPSMSMVAIDSTASGPIWHVYLLVYSEKGCL